MSHFTLNALYMYYYYAVYMYYYYTVLCYIQTSWTPEEDIILCTAQRQLGNKWSEISKLLPGRAENAVKNRFNSLITKKIGRHDYHVSFK
jgi:Myb-like DNA-binding domain